MKMPLLRHLKTFFEVETETVESVFKKLIDLKYIFSSGRKKRVKKLL